MNIIKKDSSVSLKTIIFRYVSFLQLHQQLQLQLLLQQQSTKGKMLAVVQMLEQVLLLELWLAPVLAVLLVQVLLLVQLLAVLLEQVLALLPQIQVHG